MSCYYALNIAMRVLTVTFPLHLLAVRVWYQDSTLMRLFGHPSETPMQTLALSGPVTQLGHSLSSALPSR